MYFSPLIVHNSFVNENAYSLNSFDDLFSNISVLSVKRCRNGAEFRATAMITEDLLRSITGGGIRRRVSLCGCVCTVYVGSVLS